MLQSHQLPILVTGIAGVAGYNAFAFFRKLYGDKVLGVRRKDNWRLSGEGILACDIHDEGGLADLIRRHQIRSVLHAEGTCALKSCELDPPLAHRVNVVGTENLVRFLAPDARLVFLSIDLVFSGRTAGGYTEASPTDPVTVYGKSMVAAEQVILAARPDACILRISLPMGMSFNGHAGAIDWIQSRFKQNKPATLYFDEVRTPAYTDCLNELCHHVLASNLAGLFHAGGPQPLSLYQIAQVVNRVGGYDPEHLMGCYRVEAGPIPPRAGNVVLDSSKLAGVLGSAPFFNWPLNPALIPTDRQWHLRRKPDEIGSLERIERELYRR